MRVLMVSGVFPTERAPHLGTHIKSQIDSLAQAGIEVEVIYPAPGIAAIRYAKAALEVLCRTLTRRYDVVHGHYGLWCLAARFQWTTPVVASFMGSDLFGEGRTDGKPTIKSVVIGRVSRSLSRHVDVVIVKSEYLKRLVRAPNVYVIPNGVDFDLFQPAPRKAVRLALGWDPDAYYILFGNDPRKPNKNFPLARAAVERLRTKGLLAELVVAWELSHETVAQYINASNAVILTSTEEGSPNIVKEAMACGVPVVATDVGDVAAVIGATHGCSVCPRDPEALATGLEQALLLHERTTGRGDIKHLDRVVIAQQVIAVYEQAREHRLQRPRRR
jgi:glycosyltransferase involved in cell wall biosynthesis